MYLVNNKSKIPFTIEDELIEKLRNDFPSEENYHMLREETLTSTDCAYLSSVLNKALDRKFQKDNIKEESLSYDDHKMIHRIHNLSDFLVGCIRGASRN
jgi:hypothetical protein